MHNFCCLMGIFFCGLSDGILGMREEMRINIILSVSVCHHQPSVPPPKHSHPPAQCSPFMVLVYDKTLFHSLNIILWKKKKEAIFEQLLVL